jgi:predicted amidophosphoribosyltransferase
MIAHVPPDDIYLSSVTALLSMTAENETPSPMQLIYALKYGGRYKVGYALGKALGVEIERFQRQSPESPAALPRYDAIVPVPLHASRERERGYNQALWIAQGIAEIIQTPVEASWIRRSKPTISQTTLNAEARVANVRDVFAPTRHILTNRVSTPSPISTSVSVSVSVKNASVLVVDDVFTTGSTLNACAHTLLELGARRVDAAVALAA